MELGKLLRKSINLQNKKRPNSKEFLDSLKNIISSNDRKYRKNLRN